MSSVKFHTRKSMSAHVYLLQSGVMRLCTEFNAQQLLFETFSHIKLIFDSVESQTESTFPFQYNIISETYSLEPLSSTLEGSWHVRPLTFLYRIQCSTTFIWTIFGYGAYFWQHRAPKWIYFPIFLHYNISNTSVFRAP